jgi:multisubunit Na+/H+ antiporter MnhG subunit
MEVLDYVPLPKNSTHNLKMVLTLVIYIFGAIFFSMAWIGLLTTWSYYVTEDASHNTIKLGLTVVWIGTTALGVLSYMNGHVFSLCIVFCIVGMLFLMYLMNPSKSKKSKYEKTS